MRGRLRRGNVFATQTKSRYKVEIPPTDKGFIVADSGSQLLREQGRDVYSRQRVPQIVENYISAVRELTLKSRHNPYPASGLNRAKSV